MSLVPTRWLAPMLFSVKTVSAGFLALWIGLWVGLPMPFWAMTTAFIVSNPLAGATRSKAIYRVIGTFLGAVFAVAVVPVLVDTPMVLSSVLALWVGACLTVSLLDRSARSYTLMLAGYTAAIIAFPSVNHPEAVFDTGVARVTEITLGIVAATLTHSLFLPQSVAVPLGARLERWLGDAQAWLADCVRESGPPRQSVREQQQLAVDVVDCALMAIHVPYDTSHWREATGTLRALLERMILLLPLLSGLADRRSAIATEDHDGEPCLDPDLAAAQTATRAWIAAGCPAQDRPAIAVPESVRPAVWHDLLATSYRVRLAQVVTLLADCRQALDHLRDPHLPLPASLRSPRAALRLHQDLGHALMAGLAATVAVIACCALWIYSGWADGAGAAAMTAVFCCLFAAMDNPIPVILRFGVAICAGVPLAGIYLFGVLPYVSDFAAMALVMAPPLLLIAAFIPHPRLGGQATAMAMGFCSALAIQESFHPDFERFVNSNIGQVLAVVLAAGFTAGLRNLGTDVAIARLLRALQRDLVRLSTTGSPPDPGLALARVIDQTALLTQRLGADTTGALAAQAALREVRLAINLVAIQHARAAAPLHQQRALSSLLREAARYFRAWRPDGTPPPDARLQHRIDRALRLILKDNAAVTPPPLPFGHPDAPDAPHAIAALIALRRNLFPNSPGPALPAPGTFIPVVEPSA
ncbi:MULTISPECIES: FUSC family protein [unclassified Novosphingobium]|uniref:FUSC family protein n=1 Tax=unclassified Novosphingobium TaxID=2644732 RepID=UPI00146AB4C5|nr:MULTISPECIES: FUSC family protein [unclassified Novosphingobium]NMN03166.1 putative membrane protein YccC [Novosphingobium sp. SG919]NMN86844.1 putative membrane protein YccC [Novosphingobium sp. SG916]